MFRQGGAIVIIAGFRRSQEPVSDMNGFETYDFGKTYDANFLQRIFIVSKLLLKVAKYKKIFTETDAIVARNLEMLAIAVREFSKREICKALYDSSDFNRMFNCVETIEKIVRKQW